MPYWGSVESAIRWDFCCKTLKYEKQNKTSKLVLGCKCNLDETLHKSSMPWWHFILRSYIPKKVIGEKLVPREVMLCLYTVCFRPINTKCRQVVCNTTPRLSTKFGKSTHFSSDISYSKHLTLSAGGNILQINTLEYSNYFLLKWWASFAIQAVIT